MERISFFSRILDILGPRRCVICRQRLCSTEVRLCGVCSMRLPRTVFVSSPTDNDMTRLLWGYIPVEKAVALIYYAPGSRMSRMVHSAKYGHNGELCVALGELMARETAGSGFFEGIDLMVPVPLTSGRRRKRGYNQSELLARGISNITGIPVETKAVRRQRFDGSQTGKDRFQRRENVENAFLLADGKRVAGHHLLLIDDIMTTGSTAIACARELMKAGDVKISVLTLGFTKN